MELWSFDIGVRVLSASTTNNPAWQVTIYFLHIFFVCNEQTRLRRKTAWLITNSSLLQ